MVNDTEAGLIVDVESCRPYWAVITDPTRAVIGEPACETVTVKPTSYRSVGCCGS